MKMKKKILSAAAMVALGTGSAQAVNLSSDGTGQVLLFPYYTVQGNNETLLTIVNTTDKGKAVKVRFREAFNSREVLGFNLYLAPFDVWVGKVQNAPDGGAQLYTPDNSCSTLDTNPQNMLDYDYSGGRSDGGPEGPARQREGYISVIEMGEVDWQATVLLGDDGHWYADDDDEDTLAPPAGVDTVKVEVWDRNDDGIIDIVHKNGMPNYCEGIAKNFSSMWKYDELKPPSYGFKRPSGGLMGTLVVINVQAGSEAIIPGVAIENAFLEVVHNTPGSLRPDWRDIGPTVNPDPVHSVVIDGNPYDVSGYIDAWKPRIVGLKEKSFGHMIMVNPIFDYVDALSVVLMASKVLNEYTVNPATEAETAWVVTFPTKSHYVDPEYDRDITLASEEEADGWHVDGYGKPLPYKPFTRLFNGKACEPVTFKMSNRDGEQSLVAGDSGISPRPPDGGGTSLCYGVNVIQFGSTSNVFEAKNTVVRISDDSLSGPSGWMEMVFTGKNHTLGEPTLNSYMYKGLPVIGFKMTVQGNSNVGIGSSYAAGVSHAYKREVMESRFLIPPPAMESEAKAGSPQGKDEGARQMAPELLKGAIKAAQEAEEAAQEVERLRNLGVIR